MSMLIRETSGGLALTLAAGVLISGKRRPGLIVTTLAFLPIIGWKIFVASVFWTVAGLRGLMPTPNDMGLPFEGMWHLWTLLARGEYYLAVWEMTRSAMVY